MNLLTLKYRKFCKYSERRRKKKKIGYKVASNERRLKIFLTRCGETSFLHFTSGKKGFKKSSHTLPEVADPADWDRSD